jgi:hypothetical protein
VFGRAAFIVFLEFLYILQFLNSGQNPVFCDIMAACFSVHSNSDVLSSDISAPPASQS